MQVDILVYCGNVVQMVDLGQRVSLMKSLLVAARKALDESDFETALSKCDLVIGQDPKNYNAFLFKGFALSKTQQLESAVQQFQIAISINPESPLAFQGLISISQKDPAALVENYKRLADIHAKNDSQKYYSVILKMIELYGILKEHDKVIHLWEKMLTRSEEYLQLSDYVQFSQLDIWESILKAAIEKDNYDFEREWQTQKYRVQSKSMESVKKDIQRDIHLKSRVCPNY